MVEGGGSKSYILIKRLLFEQPKLAHTLFEKLTEHAHPLPARCRWRPARASCRSSTRGAVSCRPADFERFSIPYLTRMVKAVQAKGVPVIVFGTGMSTHLPLLKRTGADVIGLDWRIADRRGPAHPRPRRGGAGQPGSARTSSCRTRSWSSAWWTSSAAPARWGTSSTWATASSRPRIRTPRSSWWMPSTSTASRSARAPDDINPVSQPGMSEAPGRVVWRVGEGDGGRDGRGQERRVPAQGTRART